MTESKHHSSCVQQKEQTERIFNQNKQLLELLLTGKMPYQGLVETSLCWQLQEMLLLARQLSIWRSKKYLEENLTLNRTKVSHYLFAFKQASWLIESRRHCCYSNYKVKHYKLDTAFTLIN